MRVSVRVFTAPWMGLSIIDTVWHHLHSRQAYDKSFKRDS